MNFLRPSGDLIWEDKTKQGCITYTKSKRARNPRSACGAADKIPIPDQLENSQIAGPRCAIGLLNTADEVIE
jgi:hypothetical protein